MNFPEKFPDINTKRFSLRKISLNDSRAYFEICSDLKLMSSYGVKAYQNQDQIHGLLAYFEEGFRAQKSIRWGIFDQNIMIGDIGFWRFVPERSRAEVAAKFIPSYWNNGAGTEVLSAVIDYGLFEMNLNSIEGNIEVNNLASIKMVNKIGFEREGHLKQHSYNEALKVYVDTYLYSIRKEHRDGKNRNC